MLFVIPAKFLWFSLTEGIRFSRCARGAVPAYCVITETASTNVLSPMQTILKICASFFSYLAEIFIPLLSIFIHLDSIFEIFRYRITSHN